MASKISEELAQRVRDALQSDPGREISIIVNLKGPANLSELENYGLTIRHRVENEKISVVSGTIAAVRAADIAQMEQVESIECDGEMWALKDQPAAF